MKILFTGASSKIGRQLVSKLAEKSSIDSIICAVHKYRPEFNSDKIKYINLDLVKDSDFAAINEPFDLVIHFAGLTHSQIESAYFDVNHAGTLRLANRVYSMGTRNFLYMSSRCATDECGSYGQSKKAAESELKKMNWNQLVIIRPAEVYGGDSNEGIDKFISLAKSFHIVPILVGDKNITFAPISIDDFLNVVLKITGKILENNVKQISEIDFCGPSSFGGFELAKRISKKYSAIMIPVPIMFLKYGPMKIYPDQIKRLTGRKTSCKPIDKKWLFGMTLKEF